MSRWTLQTGVLNWRHWFQNTPNTWPIPSLWVPRVACPPVPTSVSNRTGGRAASGTQLTILTLIEYSFPSSSLATREAHWT